jgi:hypothetical protein
MRRDKEDGVPVVVVLGMHRSGTSLVASLCQAMGVNVGDELLGAHPSQPYGHFEDVDFYHLNQRILHRLGCKWDNPPTIEHVVKHRDAWHTTAVQLMRRKSGSQLWGWKDPRTCLTLPIYWPIRDVRLVFVHRQNGDIYRSLMARSGGNAEKWKAVHKRYKQGLAWAWTRDRQQRVTILFDNLVNERTSGREVEKLAKFLGCKDIGKAMKRIHYR